MESGGKSRRYNIPQHSSKYSPTPPQEQHHHGQAGVGGGHPHSSRSLQHQPYYDHEQEDYSYEEESSVAGSSVGRRTSPQFNKYNRSSVVVTRPGSEGIREYYSPSPPRVMAERMIPERYHDERANSEIYIMDSAYTKGREPGSNYSQNQYNNNATSPSIASTNKSKTKAGVVIETMSAPNPFCPNTKGLCCLLVLINLGLILVTLGFSIVLQLFEPAFVWYCGILFLIVGFIALISSLIFLVHLCRESREAQRANGAQPGELYWTHHWQKRISLPGAGGNPRGDENGSTIYSPSTGANDQYDEGRRSRGSMPVHHSYRDRE